MQNLINFGVVPLELAHPADYDRIDQGMLCRITRVFTWTPLLVSAICSAVSYLARGGTFTTVFILLMIAAGGMYAPYGGGTTSQTPPPVRLNRPTRVPSQPGAPEGHGSGRAA